MLVLERAWCLGSTQNFRGCKIIGKPWENLSLASSCWKKTQTKWWHNNSDFLDSSKNSSASHFIRTSHRNPYIIIPLPPVTRVNNNRMRGELPRNCGQGWRSNCLTAWHTVDGHWLTIQISLTFFLKQNNTQATTSPHIPKMFIGFYDKASTFVDFREQNGTGVESANGLYHYL